MTFLAYIFIGCVLSKLFLDPNDFKCQRKIVAWSIVVWPLMLIAVLVAGD